MSKKPFRMLLLAVAAVLFLAALPVRSAQGFTGFCRCDCSVVRDCNTSADCGGSPCLKGRTCCLASR